MELRVLRYFLTIAETGSVTKGGRCGPRRPALAVASTARSLERAWGMTLFARGGKQMVLDGIRPALPSPGHDPVARADAAEAAIGALAAGRPMRITAAAPATITDVIAPFLALWGLGAARLRRLERNSMHGS